jgi:hypothetical protein
MDRNAPTPAKRGLCRCSDHVNPRKAVTRPGSAPFPRTTGELHARSRGTGPVIRVSSFARSGIHTQIEIGRFRTVQVTASSLTSWRHPVTMAVSATTSNAGRRRLSMRGPRGRSQYTPGCGSIRASLAVIRAPASSCKNHLRGHHPVVHPQSDESNCDRSGMSPRVLRSNLETSTHPSDQIRRDNRRVLPVEETKRF